MAKTICLNSTESSINVQSISICYSCKNNLPMGIYYRRFIAWIGETSMVDSMKKYLASGPITVNLIFHSKIPEKFLRNSKNIIFLYSYILIFLITAIINDVFKISINHFW